MIEEAADAFELRLRVLYQPREKNRKDVRETVSIHKWPQLHGIAAVLDQLVMVLDRVMHVDLDAAGRQFMHVMRHQPVDRVPHHVDQFDLWQVAHHSRHGPRISRELGVMRAGLAKEVGSAGVREKRRIPPPAPRINSVVAKKVRLLGPAHREARLPRELLVQRGGGALHGADHDKVWSMDHHPDDHPASEMVFKRLWRPSQ